MQNEEGNNLYLTSLSETNGRVIQHEEMDKQYYPVFKNQKTQGSLIDPTEIKQHKNSIAKLPNFQPKGGKYGFLITYFKGCNDSFSFEGRGKSNYQKCFYKFYYLTLKCSYLNQPWLA